MDIRELKDGETYSFDQPIVIENELQRVFVSQLETEPCVSGVKRQNAVEADDVGMALLAIPLVAVLVPLVILDFIGPVDCC